MTHDGPRISARALIRRSGRVLVSCYCDDAGPWYVLPGGGQRRGETLFDCLIREVREETSVEVVAGRVRWVREFISGRHADSRLDPAFHQVEVIFECELSDDATASLGANPDAGQTGLRWLTIPELAAVRFYPAELGRILTGDAKDRLYLGETG